MHKIRDILRLHAAHGLTGRQIARSLGLSHSTVLSVLHRAEALGVQWPLPAELDDAALEARLYPPNPGRSLRRPEPAWEEIHRELRRKGVTLRLLWQEYRRDHLEDGYQYSRFCERYRRWAQKLDVVLRQPHRAGEKMFVDFAGQTIPIVDRATGQAREAAIFVAALGASSFTYLEGTLAQDLPSWIGAHCRAFEFFGGAAQLLVPDNPKTAVTRACRYEPELNRTYAEMAAHYGTVIMPARPRKPRDRAKVESAVQVVERWVLAPLRHRTFFSLAELNQELAALRDRLNDTPFQKLPGTRRTLFETLERPALRPLPSQRYELAQWRKARVNIDHHCEIDRGYYSVPYQLVQEVVDVRLTMSTVEIFFKGRRVASHPRCTDLGQYRTNPEHRPASHRKHLEWTPSRLVRWAETNGTHTGALVSALLAAKPHPEQGYRACLGLIRLGKRYSAERLDAACQRALAVRAISYRSVKSILEAGLDHRPLDVQEVLPLPTHANVRGPAYYAAGASTAAGAGTAPARADALESAGELAPSMPQDRFAEGGEGSAVYPPPQAEPPDDSTRSSGTTAPTSEEMPHACSAHA